MWSVRDALMRMVYKCESFFATTTDVYTSEFVEILNNMKDEQLFELDEVIDRVRDGVRQRIESKSYNLSTAQEIQEELTEREKGNRSVQEIADRMMDNIEDELFLLSFKIVLNNHYINKDEKE